MKDYFHKLASQCSNLLGTPWSFTLALGVILVWGVTGPIFGFSDTWQLIINTGTTIVTFLMVFLIQNTQNRDAKAIQLKLDELLRAVPQARTALVDLEDLSEVELNQLQREFKLLRQLVQKTNGTPRIRAESSEAEGVPHALPENRVAS
jgi:low affinity Fe/Cu permease